MKNKGKTDKDLEDILGWVNLLNILEREGMFYVVFTLTPIKEVGMLIKNGKMSYLGVKNNVLEW